MVPSSLYCSACGAENATDRSMCFACQQPLQIVTSENIALLQGRYRILTQVGNGGFGAVYRAEDTHQHNTVAVKQINLRGLTPQETIEATDAFNREVSLLSNLSHPNLPHIYDNFTDPEHWYLVMDFIEGETLETYLEAKGASYTASLDEVLTLGLQLCIVLHYLHTCEPAIIFRDLKPANIMRTAMGKLYLIDFGIARSFKPGKLRDTIPFGSPGYAAPEQYGKAQTTPRADIYSLGALLHMLLTGDDPVDNPFHFAPLRMYSVLGLSDLETLLLRMVQIDANSRPSTIVEVRDELQRIMDMQVRPRIWHAPVGQTPPALPVVSMGSGQQQISTSSTGQQQQLYVPIAQRKRNSRRKFLVGGFAIAGLTVIGAGGIANIVSALQSSNTISGVSPSSSPFGRIFSFTENARPIMNIAWSQDTIMLASSSSDSTIQIWSKDYVLSLPTQNNLYIYHSNQVGAYLAWGNGANAHLLAYTSGQTITLLNTIKHTTSLITPSLGSSGKQVSIDITSFAWSSDGNSIAFPTSAGVQIWDVAQEKVVRHIDVDMNLRQATDFTTSFSWLSDESEGTIAVGVVANNEVIVIDVSDGKVHQRLSGVGGKSVAWSPNGNWLASISGHVVSVSLAWEGNERVFYTFPDDVTALAWSDDSQHLIAACQGNVYVWRVVLEDNEPMGGKFINGSVPSMSIGTGGTPIQSLAYASTDEGKYLAIGADKAYLLEIDVSQLNSSGQQGNTVQRRRKQKWTHSPSSAQWRAFQGPRQ